MKVEDSWARGGFGGGWGCGVGWGGGVKASHGQCPWGVVKLGNVPLLKEKSSCQIA